MTRILSLVATALVIGCTAMPAAADSRNAADIAADTGIPAAYDLKGVTWDYDDDRLRVTGDIARVRRKGVVLTARSAHDGEGYRVVARTRWRNGTKVDRLWIWFNTLDRTRVDCPGLSSRWRLGEDGFIRLSIPNSCLFEGHRMLDLSVTTYRAGYPGILDQVASAPTLASD